VNTVLSGEGGVGDIGVEKYLASTLLVYLGLKFLCFIGVYQTRALQQTVQSGNYVIEHTSYSARHADVKFADTSSCYLVAYLNDTLNSSAFRMNEMVAGRGSRRGSLMWVGGSRKCSSPAERFFFIPVIKISFVHYCTFSYSMLRSIAS